MPKVKGFSLLEVLLSLMIMTLFLFGANNMMWRLFQNVALMQRFENAYQNNFALAAHQA